MSNRLARVSANREAIDEVTEEQLARLITRLTNEVTWCMSQTSVTRADLAGRMGVSPGRVSQVLSGAENLTLRTLASLATALDSEFEFELKPRKASDDAYTFSEPR
jgi:helix-turn-helix protein